jgi:hypothetical protein
MAGKSYKSDPGGERYYLEIPGRSGKMYLAGFSFGDDFRPGFRSNSLFEKPLNLDPQDYPPIGGLANVLEGYYNDYNVVQGYPDVRKTLATAGIMKECRIWVESVKGPAKISKPMFRFLDCEVIRIPRKEGIAIYQIDLRSVLNA